MPFALVTSAGQVGHAFLLVRRDQCGAGGVSPQKVLGAPPAHRRPPAVLVLSTAVLAAPRQGEPVFSKVRFLVLWVVAVWSLLNIETP